MSRRRSRSPKKSLSKSRRRSLTHKFVRSLSSRVKEISRNLRKRFSSPSPLRLRFHQKPVRIIYGSPLYRRRSPLIIHHHHARPRSPVRFRIGTPQLAGINTTPAIREKAARMGIFLSDQEARDQRNLD